MRANEDEKGWSLSSTRPCDALQRMRAAAYIFVSPRDALSPPRALPGDRVPPRLDPILRDEQFKAEFN
jgi:hypothetical protein